MLFKQFLSLIESKFFKPFIEKKLESVRTIDPERFYVQNIMALYKLSFPAAKALCELAVKEGAFKKKIGMICPNNGHIFKEYNPDESRDEKVECLQCILNECDEHIHDTSKIESMVIYQLQE